MLGNSCRRETNEPEDDKGNEPKKKYSNKNVTAGMELHRAPCSASRVTCCCGVETTSCFIMITRDITKKNAAELCTLFMLHHCYRYYGGSFAFVHFVKIVKKVMYRALCMSEGNALRCFQRPPSGLGDVVATYCIVQTWYDSHV